MFKPSAKIKKILANYGNYAYIFNDGVIVVEKREIKIEKDNYSKLDIWHLIPCETKIRVVDYAKKYEFSTSAPEVRCLVIHNGSSIANGFDTVEVLFSAGSLGTTEKNLVIDTVRFYQNGHTWSEKSIFDVNSRQCIYGGDITIQPNPHDKWSPRLEDVSKSILCGLDFEYSRGYSVVIHGELPEENKLEEIKLLTVDN